ncbi:MAG: shikimate dehydrogenase [Sedimentisphaerales bacterium]|nr:shikimate dehydrogenase [Sedimentisphaerales bacterium]
MTYLAIPISARDVAHARRQVARAVDGGAETLELRTDYLTDLSVDRVRELVADVRSAAGASVPVIVTCRDRAEGGALDYPESLRMEVLAAAVAAGADFIDCEYANFRRADNERRIRTALSASSKARLILSAHDFAGPFPDLKRLHREILRACPEAVPKLVYKARHINDCFDAFDLLHGGGDGIVLCMGQAGLISRVLARKLGGLVTFASIDAQAATAPGQVTAAQLKGLYRHDDIDERTELFGVIADPVAHSLSPAIHNACFADAQVNGLYLPLHVEGGRGLLYDFFDNVLRRPWLGFRGFSVTIPHKHGALEYVRVQNGFIEPLAAQIGAANTVLIGRDGRLSVYNTDYAGALDAITAGMGIERRDLRDVPVAVVGAGGVSRAIVAGLSDAGARIKIYNRTLERAELLATDFGCRFAPLDDLPRLDAKLVVNCTSIGMHPHVDRSPVPAEALRPEQTVFDTVYNPARTLLLKQAREAGAKTIDGIAMFVNQAAAQFKLFTNQPANTNLMRTVVLDSLAQQ